MINHNLLMRSNVYQIHSNMTCVRKYYLVVENTVYERFRRRRMPFMRVSDRRYASYNVYD